MDGDGESDASHTPNKAKFKHLLSVVGMGRQRRSVSDLTEFNTKEPSLKQPTTETVVVGGGLR